MAAVLAEKYPDKAPQLFAIIHSAQNFHGSAWAAYDWLYQYQALSRCTLWAQEDSVLYNEACVGHAGKINSHHCLSDCHSAELAQNSVIYNHLNTPTGPQWHFIPISAYVKKYAGSSTTTVAFSGGASISTPASTVTTHSAALCGDSLVRSGICTIAMNTCPCISARSTKHLWLASDLSTSTPKTV